LVVVYPEVQLLHDVADALLHDDGEAQKVAEANVEAIVRFIPDRNLKLRLASARGRTASRP
jgi:hypothetical protein